MYLLTESRQSLFFYILSGSRAAFPETLHDLWAPIGTLWANRLAPFGFPFAAFGLPGRPLGVSDAHDIEEVYTFVYRLYAYAADLAVKTKIGGWGAQPGNRFVSFVRARGWNA